MVSESDRHGKAGGGLWRLFMLVVSGALVAAQVMNPSETNANCSALTVFGTWTVCFSAVYFFFAMLRAGDSFRDVLFNACAFPAAMTMFTLIMAGHMNELGAPNPPSPTNVQGVLVLLQSRASQILFWAMAVELVVFFHAPCTVEQNLLTIFASAFLFVGIVFKNGTTDQRELAQTFTYFALMQIAAWMFGRFAVIQTWSNVMTWDATSAKRMSAVSLKGSKRAPRKSAPSTPAAGDDDEDDTEITFSASKRHRVRKVFSDVETDTETVVTPMRSAKKKTPATKSAKRSASKRAAVTDDESETPARKPASSKKKTPAKAKKTPTKKSPARRKAFSESEDSSDDDDQAAVEYEQEQLPKELQSDHPGIKSPMRGLPKTRLRSKARVSYVSY